MEDLGCVVENARLDDLACAADFHNNDNNNNNNNNNNFNI